jgi:hypothetical protein
MSDALDLKPIKARLAATTPGEWRRADEIGAIPLRRGEVGRRRADYTSERRVAGDFWIVYRRASDVEDASALEPILEAENAGDSLDYGDAREHID